MNNNEINETKEDITFDVRQSTVFYEQWYKTIKGLPLKERDKAYKYIFEYAFYGIEPERDKTTSMSYVIFGMAKPNVDSAQKRYDAATGNGQKGGRPPKVTELVRANILELRKNGMTQKQVASELGLSLKTIQRVEKDISQNHNENVNDNVNENINLNVNIVSSAENDKKLTVIKTSAPQDPVNENEIKKYEDYSPAERNDMFLYYKKSADVDETAYKYKIDKDILHRILKEEQDKLPYVC